MVFSFLEKNLKLTVPYYKSKKHHNYSTIFFRIKGVSSIFTHKGLGSNRLDWFYRNLTKNNIFNYKNFVYFGVIIRVFINFLV